MNFEDLSWLDILLATLLVIRVYGAGGKRLGDALHDLLAIGLLIGLFIGFRMGGELRDLIYGVAADMQWTPGLGGKLLIIAGAWVLMLTIKRRLGYWLEAVIPRPAHGFMTLFAEIFRTVLLAWILVWLLSPWYSHGPGSPLVVQLLR